MNYTTRYYFYFYFYFGNRLPAAVGGA